MHPFLGKTAPRLKARLITKVCCIRGVVGFLMSVLHAILPGALLRIVNIEVAKAPPQVIKDLRWHFRSLKMANACPSATRTATGKTGATGDMQTHLGFMSGSRQTSTSARYLVPWACPSRAWMRRRCPCPPVYFRWAKPSNSDTSATRIQSNWCVGMSRQAAPIDDYRDHVPWCELLPMQLPAVPSPLVPLP